MTNWIDLPNSADTAQQLVSMFMPGSVDYFCCARLRGSHYDFWSVNIHGDHGRVVASGHGRVVASGHGETISEALTKAVQEFWGKYHDTGDVA